MARSSPVWDVSDQQSFADVRPNFFQGGSAFSHERKKYLARSGPRSVQLSLFQRPPLSIPSPASDLPRKGRLAVVSSLGKLVEGATHEECLIASTKYQSLPLAGRASNVVAVLPATKGRLMRRSFCDAVRRNRVYLQIAEKLASAGYVRIGDVAQMDVEQFASAGVTARQAETVRHLLEDWRLRAAARVHDWERPSSVEIKGFVFGGASPTVVRPGVGPNWPDAV